MVLGRVSGVSVDHYCLPELRDKKCSVVETWRGGGVPMFPPLQ